MKKFRIALASLVFVVFLAGLVMSPGAQQAGQCDPQKCQKAGSLTICDSQPEQKDGTLVGNCMAVESVVCQDANDSTKTVGGQKTTFFTCTTSDGGGGCSLPGCPSQ